MLTPIQNLYRNSRRRAAIVLGKRRWLPPVGTVLSATILAVGLASGWHPAFAVAAGMSLAAASYLWGYATRSFREPSWPGLAHLERQQYAATWDALAHSREAAVIAVSGKRLEDELRNSAADPVRNLIELASISEQDDVLEIGCGIGRIGMELAPRCRSWTGADVSANMLGYATDRLRGIRNVRLQQLQSGNLSEFPDQSFDVVYATNMLAHLDEIDRWWHVREAFRVLRLGGRIFLDTIDVTSEEGWAMFTNIASRFYEHQRPPYMTRFSVPGELANYVTRAGFESVQIHSKPPLVIVTGAKMKTLTS